MLRLAADENFNQHVVNGLRRRLPDVDVLTVRTAGLEGTPDPGVLAWAARERRVLVTHDTRTLRGYAYERVAVGEPMPGVLEIPDLMAVGRAVDELEILVELLEPSEIAGRVLRLPL